MQRPNHTEQELNANRRLKAFYDAANFISAGDTLAPEDKLHLFVTAHFASRKQDDVHNCCSYFRNRIDRKILGRSGHRLYKALWLEDGEQAQTSTSNTTHAHWLFEIPVNVTEKAFKHVFCALWTDICCHTDIKFKHVDIELGGIHGLVNYCVKESSIGNTGTFIEHCSDNARLQKNRKSRHPQQR